MTNTGATITIHPSIQDTAEDHKRKFGDVPATEESLRDLAALPSWAAVPPLVVELVNAHLGHGETVEGDGDVPDLFGTVLSGLDSFFAKR